MSYVGSRYLVIGSAAPGDTFVLERGTAECSSLRFGSDANKRGPLLYLDFTRQWRLMTLDAMTDQYGTNDPIVVRYGSKPNLMVSK